MLRKSLLALVVICSTAVGAIWLLPAPVANPQVDEHAATGFERGPHGGRLLRDGAFSVEITIFETGTPPEFHVYPSLDDKPLAPESVQLGITLSRTGGVVDRFRFEPRGDYLRSADSVTEPHSFDVSVAAVYAGRKYAWRYQSYEGRTQIPDAMARQAGIATEKAGPATIVETRVLTGRVQTDPARLAGVRARFPGVVKTVHVDIGDTVQPGERLLTIQSNESLQDYIVAAPIAGQVTGRSVQPGNAVFDDVLISIADLSRVWIDLDVFPGDAGSVSPGQTARLETLEGIRVSGVIEVFAPMGNPATQSVTARLDVENPGGRLRPGQFVRAEVDIASHDVAVAVRPSAVQAFRDFDVVFARFGDTYEVRMLEIGRRSEEWIEILGGLAPGTEYVTENSYLIKADIEKSGASHDH